MAHPYSGIVVHLFEQVGKFFQHQLGSAEFAMRGRVNPAAQQVGDELHAIADPENGSSQLKQFSVTKEGVFFQNACRSAGENNAFCIKSYDFIKRQSARVDFAKDLAFPHFTGDVLGVLRPEIKNENFLLVKGVCGHGNAGVRLACLEKFRRFNRYCSLVLLWSRSHHERGFPEDPLA